MRSIFPLFGRRAPPAETVEPVVEAPAVVEPVVEPPIDMPPLDLPRAVGVPRSRISAFLPDGGRVMITDHGPHPPDLWAQATGEHIVRIGDDVTGTRLLAARALQERVIGVLVSHHDAVQQDERGQLAASPAQFQAELDRTSRVDEIIPEIQAAAAGTEWAAHFADPDIVTMLKQEIGRHFATSRDIERGWHANRNPMLPEAMAWRAMRQSGG